jgi:hypothetical protein
MPLFSTENDFIGHKSERFGQNCRFRWVDLVLVSVKVAS